MASYAELVAQGKIKSFHNRSSINQPGLNEIAGDNERGENALTEAQELTGNSAINFTHSTDSVSTRISNISVNNTNSSFDLINIDVLENKIISNTRSYFDVLLSNTLSKEEKTVSLYKNAIKTINGKQDVLDFYNKKTTSKKKIDLQDYYKKLISAYMSIEGVAPNSKENINKIKLAQQQIRMLSASFTTEEIDERLMTNPQFISMYRLMTGDLLDVLLLPDVSPISKEDKKQLERSGKTLLEFIENLNLIDFLTGLVGNEKDNISSVTVKGVGASRSDPLKEFLLKNINSLQPATIEQYKKLYIDFINDRLPKIISAAQKKNKTVGLQNFISLGMLTNQGEPDASGKIRDDVVDIDIILQLKTGQTIYTKVDAKFGSEDRYKGSKVEYSAGWTIDSVLKDISYNNQDFNLFMKIIILYWVANRIMGTENIELGVKLTSLMTYAILSSKWFAEKFGFKNNISDQADFLAIKNEYIWFSDFLKFFITRYLEQKKGRKPSVDISDAMNKSAPLITQIKNQINIITTVEELAKLSDNENITSILLEIKEFFLNSGVSFDPDFNGILNSIK